MSGFLDDYTLLREGAPGEVALVYRNPDADWTRYDKVLLEPVTLWRSGWNSLDPVPEDDLLRLVSAFENALRRQLGAGFRLVDQPGPGVIRIRLAITEARASDPILDVLRAALCRKRGRRWKSSTPSVAASTCKASVTACLRSPGDGPQRRQEVRTFGTTPELLRLADWLTAAGLHARRDGVDRRLLAARLQSPRGQLCARPARRRQGDRRVHAVGLSSAIQRTLASTGWRV
jgi:Protein of unknown function (DUF3313)